MTTDLEKQFFDTFGIEKERFELLNPETKDGKVSYYTVEEYPQITDHILLELVCIARQYREAVEYYADKQGLKRAVLRALIYCYECGIDNKFIYTNKEAQELKQQVQALFKE